MAQADLVDVVDRPRATHGEPSRRNEGEVEGIRASTPKPNSKLKGSPKRHRCHDHAPYAEASAEWPSNERCHETTNGAEREGDTDQGGGHLEFVDRKEHEGGPADA